VAPLRHLASAPAVNAPELVPPAVAVRLRFNQNKDTPLPPEEPAGENPPAGAVLDYLLPEGTTGLVRLDILTADGKGIQSFDSETTPPQPEARVYMADLWLGKPKPLPSGPGHHRFVWNLRYPPPPTLRSEYSIAAVPREPTPILPQGAFVLPGKYAVKLTAGGRSVTRPLEVTMDPRVHVSQKELASLLEFQQQVASVLERAVRLDKAIEAESDTTETAETAGPETPRPSSEVAETLTALAIDLEQGDAPPTAPQREVLRRETERLEKAENEWGQ
jgi:hypothetical protein